MNTLNDVLGVIVQMVLVPGMIYGLALLRNFILERIKSTRFARAINQAMDAVELAVLETGQTYVDGIKGTKDWDDAAQAKAFSQALERAKYIMGSEGLKLLETVVGDVNAYLTAAIEAEVSVNKAPKEIAYAPNND